MADTVSDFVVKRLSMWGVDRIFGQAPGSGRWPRIGRWLSMPTPIRRCRRSPHIKTEQAKAYVSALRHGEPETCGIVKSSMKQFMKNFVPGG